MEALYLAISYGRASFVLATLLRFALHRPQAGRRRLGHLGSLLLLR